MKYVFSLLVLILVLFATACSIHGLNVGVPVAAGEPPLPQIITVPPNATATPTPFQPSLPTPTYLPPEPPTQEPALQETAVATEVVAEAPDENTEADSSPEVQPGVEKTWADYPGPVVWPDIVIPPPVGILPRPEGQVNILLLGSDQRPNDPGFRTDTILLLTLNPKLGVASLTSFPRDLYVYIPGWTVQRINTAQVHGGFEATALTFEYNFGVRPDYYVLVNMRSFVNLIDALNGVDVNVAVPLTDHRDGYGKFSVPAGVVHMDGETALWYVRSRYTTSDFDRGRRQIEVLKACFDKLISLDALNRARELYQIYSQGVVTNMTFDQMAVFLPLAAQLRDSSRLRRYAIGPSQVTNWINSNGAYVLLPQREAVLSVMRQALNIP